MTEMRRYILGAVQVSWARDPPAGSRVAGGVHLARLNSSSIVCRSVTITTLVRKITRQLKSSSSEVAKMLSRQVRGAELEHLFRLRR